MPDDDWMLGSNTVDFRNEERRFALGRLPDRLQLPACDRCTQGVMDATNSHYLGVCSCSCHNPGPVSVPPDDREPAA